MSPALIAIPGGKFYANVIDGLIPSHWTELVSPFLGGGHLEQKLALRVVRVFGSDINGDLVNTWQQVLSRPDRVADSVARYAPLVRNRERFWDLKRVVGYVPDKAINAAAFLVTNKMSFNGLHGASGGFSRSKHDKFMRGLGDYVERVRQYRCPNLSVEHMDYRVALTKRAHVPAYVDPPYDLPGGNELYGDEGRNFCHEELAELLTERHSPWILSYNKSDRILDLYEGYSIVDLSGKWVHQSCGAKNDSSEIVIVSHDIVVPEGFGVCAA
jgi:site-specific DNA-adenine methylase